MRRWQVAVLAVLGVLAVACDGAGVAGEAAPTATKTTATSGNAAGYPAVMAALGDSITAGVGSCLAYLNCDKNSWAAGGSNLVDSHYRRILAKSSKIKGKVYNFSEPGAQADALHTQALQAIDAKAQYVTILIGANDACARSVDAMTPVTAYREQIDRALDELKDGLPEARVLVVSIPDLYRLWQVGSRSNQAVKVWSRGGICPSMLADPTSTANADQERREAVRDRIDAYDQQLRKACSAYGEKCRWDGGAVHDVRFTLDLVNTVDYFHPNAEGQNELAEVTWPGRFDW
ncbi:GDSL-type esterase/lipase family protein [Actinoplanes sp. NPDC051851]|uniref:SGNH/GDSL hydrolase family protein n=1 Tax=Actinoplanes sp. NPDC051851 TaxID=3154753 RepID=UPI00343A3B86